MRYLILIAAIVLSSCEVPVGTSIDSTFPFPHPPKSSHLSETVRFSEPRNSIERVLTNHGVLFAEQDGIYRVDYAGKRSLFVSWDQIPNFKHSTSYDDEWCFRIDRLADDSIILSSSADYNNDTYTKEFYFQHVSKDGQPLELIRARLNASKSVDEVQSIDSSHALAYGPRGILDFKNKTYIPISQENDFTETRFQIVGSHIITTDRGQMPDCACRASILVYDLKGKLSTKRSLDEIAPVQGISQYAGAHFASGVLPLSPHLGGVWIWREPNRNFGHNDTGLAGYYFFAFDADQLGSTQGVQLGYAQKIPRPDYSDYNFSMRWLGGLNFVWPAKFEKVWRDGLEFTSINNGQLVQNDFIFNDWKMDSSETSRTDDGSLSRFEYSPSQKVFRIRLINPDGAVRLSEVLPLGDPSSWKWKMRAQHTMLGSHIMINVDDQTIVYEIIDSPKENTL